MWEEFKTFRYPFALTAGLISLIAISIITLSYQFGLGILFIINFSFLVGWFYFLIGSYVKIKYSERAESEKHSRNVVVIAAPLLVLLSSSFSLILNKNLPPKFTNYFLFNLLLTISYGILFLFTIKKQWQQKTNLLITVLSIIGVITLFYFPHYINSSFLKWILILLGFACLISAIMIHVKQILHGDELERQIHLESLAYVFPFSMLVIIFLYLLHSHFKITLDEKIIGYLPLIFLLIYSFVAKLRRMKYS
jgi:hypothetical protein